MSEHGIRLLKSLGHKHESNCITERFNRKIVTKAYTLLVNFSNFLCSESIATAACLYNRNPDWSINYQIPIRLLEGSLPSLSRLHK